MHINKIIQDMEIFARKENIPIMQESSLLFIIEYIKNNNIKNVLEIGTAIAYSTIRIASNGIKITSIERDETRYKEAVKNVELAKLKNEVTLIKKDAFETNIEEKYDLIIIDAAKGKNKDFIEKFEKNLNPGGTIIIDNIDFHGLVGKSSEIKSRNLRSLVRKIENFLTYLEEQTKYTVEKKNIGDGLIILKEE
ncbi:MAG: O-methyltransferase [Bacilli bacterium]|nr:O-methyltransferase [Bacilli bacterium]